VIQEASDRAPGTLPYQRPPGSSCSWVTVARMVIRPFPASWTRESADEGMMAERGHLDASLPVHTHP
jgi:hypothetical protein